LRSFRFPVKYLALGVFALAVLAAYGWQALLERRVDRRTIRTILVGGACVAAPAYVLVAWLLVAPQLPAVAFYRLAEAVRIPFPVQAAQYLLFGVRPLLTALFLKLLCAGFLLAVAVSARRERRVALLALGILLTIDLIAANRSANPTISADVLKRPEWVDIVTAHPGSRTYVGGRLNGTIDVLDPDSPKWASFDGNFTPLEQRYIASNQLVYAPSGWQIREGVSYDLPLLWPLEYARMLARFKIASREERLRYLSNTGVRYCILPTPPTPDAQPLATLASLEQMRLYECNPHAARAYVVPDALMGADVGWQIEGLFQERFKPADGVLVSETPPPAAGTPGAPVKPAALIVDDHANRVVVRAGLPTDGYLALLDSYDPNWRVNVDGTPAQLMQANGLFRAVHLTPGEHTVVFSYHPRALYLGAAITALTGVGLLVLWLVDRRRPLFARAAVAEAALSHT
jgi:hypothetical protein